MPAKPSPSSDRLEALDGSWRLGRRILSVDLCGSGKVCREALYSIKRQPGQKCITEWKKKITCHKIRSKQQTGEAKRAGADMRQRPGPGVRETGAMVDVRARRSPPNPPSSVNSHSVPRRYRAERAGENKKPGTKAAPGFFVPFAKRAIRRRLLQPWSALRSNPVRPP